MDPSPREQSPLPAPASRGAAIGIALATTAVLLPFLGKAFHIDDPFYVWVAQHVLAHPFDFFGLTVNWSGVEEPLAAVNKNPPLVSYFLAALGAVFGWSERALHVGFLLPALGVTLATFTLARRWGGDPVVAALLCLATPLFLVSATSVMSDVPMLALFCAALACWVAAIDDDRLGLGFCAGVLAAACALTKYFGVAWVPLALAYGALRRRKLGAWALPLLVPVAAVVAYELYTRSLYGEGLLGRAAGYAVLTRPELPVLERLGVALVFAGGGLVAALPGAWSALARRERIAAALAALGIVALAIGRGRWGGLDVAPGELGLLAHLLVFALAAAVLLALGATALRRRPDAITIVLGLWIAGTFVFSAFVNYTTNARTLLPMAPAIALLVARESAGSRAWRLAALGPGLAIALAAADGDRRSAEASREVAQHLGARFAEAPETLWFEGTWGFQHYMTEVGARRVDVQRSILRPGDRLVTPSQVLLPLPLPPGSDRVEQRVAGRPQRFTTMSTRRGTGFHAIQWGPLPYRFAAPVTETFDVRRILRFVVFEEDAEVLAARSRGLAAAETSFAALLATLDAGLSSSPDCAAVHAALRATAEPRCRWCATPDECAQCVDERLRDAHGPARCAEVVRESWQRTRERCASVADPPDPLCDAVERRRRQLAREP